MLQVPEMLRCPPKLYPVITEFNNYLYFLLEGGRGSGKTQVIARWILYIGEKRKIKVCCGREIQKSIEGLVRQNNLNWKMTDKELIHRNTGSRIFFQGFREQGKSRRIIERPDNTFRQCYSNAFCCGKR